MNNKNKEYRRIENPKFEAEEPKFYIEEPKLTLEAEEPKFHVEEVQPIFEAEDPKEATAYTPQYRLERIKWRFHPHDDDPFPSIPHGHSLDGDAAYKLQVYKGEIYKDRNVKAKLRKKEYDRLWADKKFLQLIETAKKYHADKNSGKQENIIELNNQHDDSLVVEFETEVEFEIQ